MLTFPVIICYIYCMGGSTKTLTVLKYQGEDLEFVAEIPLIESGRLLDVLNAHKISINQSCGGFGSCTTCRIFVKFGQEKLSEKSELELEHARDRGFAMNERLACQTEFDVLTIQNLEIILPQ